MISIEKLNFLINYDIFFKQISNNFFNYFKVEDKLLKFLVSHLNSRDSIKFKKNLKIQPLNLKYPLIFYYYIGKFKKKISYDDFQYLYYTNCIDLNHSYSNISNELNDIYIKISRNVFMPLDIRHYIENKLNNVNIYESDNFKLYYFYFNIIDNNLLKNFNIIINWLINIKNKHLDNPLTIIYFDCPLNKKHLNFNLISTNINSGTSYHDEHTIMIFRRQEAIKVLIHELIHILNLDFKSINDENIIIGKYNYPIIINETLTEIMAQYLHSIFLAYYKNDFKHNNEFFNLFRRIYLYENIYNWIQLNSIFKYYNISKFDYNIIKKKFNQTSNVYSYYIDKVILLTSNYELLELLFFRQKNLLLININMIKIKNNDLVINFIKKCNIINDSLNMCYFQI